MDLSHCRWGSNVCLSPGQEDEPLHPFGDGKINKRLDGREMIQAHKDNEIHSVDVRVCLEGVFESFIVEPVQFDSFVRGRCGTASRSDEDRFICFTQKTSEDGASFARAACNEDCHCNEEVCWKCWRCKQNLAPFIR